MRESFEEDAFPSGNWIGRGNIRVECREDQPGEETPERFKLGQRRIEVVDVTDRWLAPDHCYFKVQADDGGEYILRHDSQTDLWELTAFVQAESDLPSTD